MQTPSLNTGEPSAMIPRADNASASGGNGLESRQREMISRALREVEEAESRATTTSGKRGSARSFTLPPDSFAGYMLLGELHRGGQGVVYQAMQHSTNRKVAIKVLREGPFAGPADHARFEREVRTLAALNHPNIVAIHDSGEQAGLFYIVMDYIAGQSLDGYVASAERTIPEIVALFGKICEAVNAAHLRGIMHRDLKPSNIRIDPQGEPHILDFGLAKLSGDAARSEAERAMTMTGQFVGSLPWASPEQAAGDSAGIDLRTDVYSLGVILYKMLTGSFPFDATGSWREALDRVANDEPTRPRTLRREVDDELETIVLKCLSKNRERRYQSAGDLARDLDRYRAGEPIEAKRDSNLYILRKLVARHRVKAAVAAGYVVVVSAGLVISLGLWRTAKFEWERAEGETGRANTALGVADEQRIIADDQRREAEAQRDEARTTMDLFRQIVASAKPSRTLRADYTLREALDEFSRSFDNQPMPPPAVEANVRATLGDTYWQLGDYATAEAQLRRALALQRAMYDGPHLEIASSLNNVGLILDLTGRNDEAIAVFEESLALRRILFGDESAQVATSMQNLGHVLRESGRLEEAEPLLQRALDIRRATYGEEHPFYAAALTKLARVLQARGDSTQAEAKMRQALELCDRTLPADQPDRAHHLHYLATIVAAYDPAAAEEMYREALSIRRQTLGADHLIVTATGGALARLLHRLGELEEAETLLRHEIQVRSATQGEARSTVVSARVELAEVLRKKGQFDVAEAVLLAGWSALATGEVATNDSKRRIAGALVELYDEWSGAQSSAALAEEAAAWRRVLSDLRAPD